MTLRQSKSDILFDRLRHDILTLDLPPGMALRLPALSERYAIGLTPLRECLNRLAAEQLVVPEHNKGFCVTPLTRADLLDLERSRDAIEGAMLAHSVSHADDAWEAGVIGAYH
ncbi:MAG TPA: GntR family transcriptional regulator, partial [Sulfitobacter pontiacus]|nr:GntR family transcriptional regulator [Sulfitobacter pontiacus]